MKNTDIREMFVTAPESQIDKPLREMIVKWSNEPTAIEILEVLDHAICFSLASDFVVSMLQMVYESKPKEEKKLAEIYAKEHWRKTLLG